MMVLWGLGFGLVACVRERERERDGGGREEVDNDDETIARATVMKCFLSLSLSSPFSLALYCCFAFCIAHLIDSPSVVVVSVLE